MDALIGVELGGGVNSEWRRVFKFVITVYLLLASVLHC